MLKKIKTLFIALIVTSATGLAQSPSQINYQGAARDGAGAPIANQQIRVRLKVHDGTSNGTVQYSEVRKPTTNANGLFNIVIGSTGALSTTGSFAAITWENGNKYLQVEMDPTGGTSYANMGTQQLVSVPYAQYSNTAGALKFPLYAIDSTVSVMFDIENKNSAAVRGTSTGSSGVVGISQNGNGIYGYSYSPTLGAVSGVNISGGPGVRGISQLNHGISGESQSANFAGVYGFNPTGDGISALSYSSSHSGVKANNTGGGNAIDATATTGMGVYGYSNTNSAVFGANNSISQSAVSGFNYNSGAGVTGFSQNGIGVVGNNGTAAWPAIQGTNNLGVGVKGISASSSGAGVEGTNSGTGAGIKGTSSNINGLGVSGINTAGGKGVYGSSTTGTGVSGVSDNIAVSGVTTAGTGLYGNSFTGSAIYGYSASGYALDVSGKVKIAGTSQNPAAGKVLTSDANGNATWEGAVAFSTEYVGSVSVPPAPATMIVAFAGERYDLGNNFNTSTKKFTAPVNGIYHFDAQIQWDYLYDNFTSILKLKVKHGATVNDEYTQYFSVTSNGFYGNTISADVMLYANDEVYLEVSHSSGNAQNLYSSAGHNHFNGRLVVKL
jgi:C1q domain-containing protein